MGGMAEMKILVNGDSFCDERYFEASERLAHNQKWSETLGATNIAHGGCSNGRIFHSTIEYLNYHEIDILIIGWTEWNRYMLTLTNGLELHICPNSAGDNVHLWGNTNYLPHCQYYYKYFHNEYLNFKSWLGHYLLLQDYCSLKKIKFINFFTVPHNMPQGMELYNIAKSGYIEENLETDKKRYIEGREKIRLRRNEYITELKNRISKINKMCWVNNQVGYSYNIFSQQFPRAKDGHHPGTEASAEWAKLIMAHIT